MKKYIKPEMEIELFDLICDIITASGGDEYKEDNFNISNPPSFGD